MLEVLILALIIQLVFLDSFASCNGEALSMLLTNATAKMHITTAVAKTLLS